MAVTVDGVYLLPYVLKTVTKLLVETLFLVSFYADAANYCSGRILLSCCMFLCCKCASFQFERLPKLFTLRGVGEVALLLPSLCSICVIQIFLKFSF